MFLRERAARVYSGWRAGGARWVVALALLAGCSSEPAAVAVAVDAGGGDGVALLGDVVVQAEAGDVLTISHDGAPAPEGDEAPVTHAFVGGAEDRLPPLFTPAGGGLTPNAGVWGPCAGGNAADAIGRCPVPPTTSPEWDGRSYWATGAMLPGEKRELRLAADLPDGDVRLVCAIHPQLRVLVRTEGDVPSPAAAAVTPDAAVTAAHAQPSAPGRVLAGSHVEGAYVGRFVPDEVRIRAGESVTWVAGARAPVDVVFGGGDLDLSHTTPADAAPAGNAAGWNGKGELRSGFLSADRDAGAVGSRWRVTFLRPGRYEYASRFGSAWRGVVIVEER